MNDEYGRDVREHLTTEQAAEYLGVSPGWLANARCRGDGGLDRGLYGTAAVARAGARRELGSRNLAAGRLHDRRDAFGSRAGSATGERDE